jgi:hypothetical protein
MADKFLTGAGLPVSESTKRRSSEVEKTHPYRDGRNAEEKNPRRTRRGGHSSMGG